jgi:uncharacterized repeat protein (TIGR01451 family)
VVIAQPYFEVGKTYQSSRVAGTVVTYTLTVDNIGNEEGTNVVLSDTLPANLTFGGSDGNWDGSDITWAFDSLAPGGSETGWFSSVMTCTAGLSVNNKHYRVVSSEQGVDSMMGNPVTFDVIAPTLDAAFDQSASSAVVSTTFFFTDSSTTNGVPIVDWEWDFGDNSDHASTPDASHAYRYDGAFTVILTTTDSCGYTDAQTTTVTVQAPELLANFDQSATTAVVSATIAFTDTSTTDGPDIVAWEWDFGDGTSVFTRDASHAYLRDDIFTVTLIVTDDLGYSDWATSTVTVQAPDLVANFDYYPYPAYILVGDTVWFTDTSETNGPDIVAWAWDFGDGGTGSITDSNHTYTTVGTYTVGLVVTDALGHSASETKTDIVVVSPRCTPLTAVTFEYAPTNPVILSPVVYTATTLPVDATTPITFTWDFGDGITMTTTSTVVPHTFTISGTRTVQVTAYNLCTPAGVISDPSIIEVAPIRIFLPLILRN